MEALSFTVVMQTTKASRKYLFALFTILVVVEVECGCRSLRTSTHIKQGIKSGMFSGQFVSRSYRGIRGGVLSGQVKLFPDTTR